MKVLILDSGKRLVWDSEGKRIWELCGSSLEVLKKIQTEATRLTQNGISNVYYETESAYEFGIEVSLEQEK